MAQNKNAKVCFRLFMPWQEEDETRWLESMARKGWHLLDVKTIQYIFIKGEPKEVLYRFDYKMNKNDDFDEYVALFKDAGWEYVTSLNHWIYFRADANKVSNPDIYTDNESRILKYKSILKILYVAGFPSFYFATIWFPIFGNRNHANYNLLFDIAHILVIIVAIMMAYSIIRVYSMIKKLRKEPKQ
jgi:hypothetical protein